MTCGNKFSGITLAIVACPFGCGVAIVDSQTCASNKAIALTPLKKSIYHHGWIDLTKNGKGDVYENPNELIDKRVDDLLSQMSMKGKTMQLVTLYGYGRALKDVMPTPQWSKALWEDGVANIDEEFNGVAYSKGHKSKYV
jgi:hypothetical protein